MKKVMLFLSLLFTLISSSAQSIYTKDFGNAADIPVIFLHGGPGYNCANFEATTAQALADQGLHVIVYDRRGEGRSIGMKAKFTFQEAFDDLNEVFRKYGLQRALLIGHSFGGVIATLFAEQYPERVSSLLLVGAPVSLQETFRTIISTSKAIYRAKGDSTNLKFITLLENMNKNSLEYSSYCFMHAMQNGFYVPRNPTDQAKALYAKFKTDSLLIKYAAKMTYEATQGFWKNEQYTSIDLAPVLKKLVGNGTIISAVYGREDGLYTEGQINELRSIVGEQNLLYLDDCSHNVFIDQQATFIATVAKDAQKASAPQHLICCEGYSR